MRCILLFQYASLHQPLPELGGQPGREGLLGALASCTQPAKLGITSPNKFDVPGFGASSLIGFQIAVDCGETVPDGSCDVYAAWKLRKGLENASGLRSLRFQTSCLGNRFRSHMQWVKILEVCKLNF